MEALFLGGDKRQKYASDYLNKYKIPSNYYPEFSFDEEFIDKIQKSDAIILPLPVSKDGSYLNIDSEPKSKIKVFDIIDLISERQLLLGGKFSPEMKNVLTAKGSKYIDYFDSETFQVKNALLTAEGAIYYAKDKIANTIHGANIAILGFGRIGKILAYLLRCQGALITVFARKDLDRTWSDLIGFKALKIRKNGILGQSEALAQGFDIIFNTIPYKILDENFIRSLDKNTVIIDLASFPYGIEDDLIEKYDLNYYRELSIPGRYAPKSAGEILGNIIINIIRQED